MKSQNKRKRWGQCQERLIEWRSQHPITNEMAMPGYDHSAQLISKYVSHGDFLLDIGCKTGGLHDSVFFPKEINYFGLDPLRIEGEEYLFPFECMMIEEAVDVYGRAVFDCAHIRDSIDYFSDLSRSLQAISKILKTNGILIISEGDHHPKRIGATIRLWSNKLTHFLNHNSIHAHDTYPNGDYSIKFIKTKLLRARFSVVFEELKDGRFDLVVRK
jgi:SAM-dependent methyltransferase